MGSHSYLPNLDTNMDLLTATHILDPESLSSMEVWKYSSVGMFDLEQFANEMLLDLNT